MTTAMLRFSKAIAATRAAKDKAARQISVLKFHRKTLSKPMVDIRECIIDYHLKTSFPDCPEIIDLFAKAVYNQTSIELPRGLFRAECSPPRRKPGAPKGQTDIGLFYSDESAQAMLLVENKIFSPFTARQPERYVEEAEWLVANGGYAHAIPVLLCPVLYQDRVAASRVQVFPVCVTYEQLADQFPTQDGRDAIKRAIEKCATGLITIEVPAVSNNFEGYKFLLRQMRPDIEMMTSADGKGARARTVRFSIQLNDGTSTRDHGLTLLHQWQQQRVKILLDGARHRPDCDALEARIRDNGKRFGMDLDPKASDSIGLFCPIPIIVNDGAWDAQIEAAAIGIANVGKLADWLRDNDLIWRNWCKEAI